MKFLCILLLGMLVVGICSASSLLEDLPSLKGYVAKRVSSYDRTGGNADGLQTNPIKPGETRVLAELKGPGAITHIWITIASKDKFHLRNLVIKMWWDGEEAPSVEAPIGDFFGLGHAKYYQYACLPIEIGTQRGLNCFWFMPFRKSAKIAVTNEGPVQVDAFYYYIDYREYSTSLPRNFAYFHAKYRQEFPCLPGKPYLILEAKGRGHYVGCNLSIHLNQNGWWGEGDDMIFVDGEPTPSLHGTGSEDYFCGAWGFGGTFSNLFFGLPLRGEHRKGALWNVYRYHIQDPVPFKKSIRVVIEHGHNNDRADDFASVAYWYQTEPHTDFWTLPPAEERMPAALLTPIKGAIEAEKLPVLASSGDPLSPQDMTPFSGMWNNNEQLFFRPDSVGDYFVIELPVEKSGTYEIIGYFTKAPDYGIFKTYIDGKEIGKPFDGFYSTVVPSGAVNLGRMRLEAGKHMIKFEVVGKNKASTGYFIGVDCLVPRLVEDNGAKEGK